MIDTKKKSKRKKLMRNEKAELGIFTLQFREGRIAEQNFEIKFP